MMILFTPQSLTLLPLRQELAKSLRRSSGGGGVIKAGAELESSLAESSPSPTRGQRGDNDDAESIMFMEQGRQVYDASHARSQAAAATLVAGAAKSRPTTAKSGPSGNARPSSA